MQDSFVVGSMSYYLMPYFFNGNQATQDYTTNNYFVPITYPCKSPNFGTPPAVTNPSAGVALDPGNSMFWDGYLSYEVDKKVIIPYWNCSRHYYAPQQQQQPYYSPATNVAVPTAYAISQQDGSTDTFYPVEPTIIMGGGRQNVWKLNLPANIPSTIAPFNQSGYGTSWYMKACLRFHGILAHNSTSVK